MSSTAEQIRAWRGPALLTYGFCPFFLGAAIWTVLIMALLQLGQMPSGLAFSGLRRHSTCGWRGQSV